MNKKVVVITGAAGGIGSVLAHRMCADGYRLVLTDRISCESVIRALPAEGSDALDIPGDLSDERSVQELIEKVQTAVGTVDILVNNAALMGFYPLDVLTSEMLRGTLRVNVEASFQLAKTFSSGMTKRGWGRIINLVSGSVARPPKGFIAYVASKMAIVGLTRALAVELGEYGITVNAVSPALTRTASSVGVVPPEIWEGEIVKQSIKRSAVPEDLVGVISFLCSKDADFITGQTIYADGGSVMTC